MPKVTILGSGIIGMAIASMLSRSHDVTIVARDLPGDSDSLGWASPWAGACFIPMDGSPPSEQKMQRDSFAFLWALAATNPESSVRRIELNCYEDETPLEKIWYRDVMPEFRVMDSKGLPEGVKLGISYKTVVLTPPVFLPWLAKRLKDSGVTFHRKDVKTLRELKDYGHDVLVNATGWGAKFLHDVEDPKLQQVRGQTVLVKSGLEKIVVRHGKDYTYAIPRLDGTVILGGIKQVGSTDAAVDIDVRDDILRRVEENAPDTFKGRDRKNVEIVRDIVGIRPAREGGVRVEKEVLDGQNVVHAYGTSGGGFVYSFGVARAAGTLVNDFLFALPPSPKL